MPKSRALFLIIPMILSLVTTAAADPNDLAGGVLITHYVPMGERYYPLGCDGYMQYARITTCSEQDPTVMLNDFANFIEWFVLAAWAEDKVFCGAEFGLGEYDPSMLIFLDHGPCGPDALWIPTSDPDWPAPNSGIAIAWGRDNSPSGNFVPIYQAACYAYGPYYGSTSVPLAPDPSQDFIGFASCEVPSVLYPAEDWGVLGINEPGVSVCPAGWIDAVEETTDPDPWIARPAPNPFHASTRLSFRIPPSDGVEIGIYDACGRLVRMLPAEPVVEWDGRDAAGLRVPAGSYFCRMTSGDRTIAQRVVVVD